MPTVTNESTPGATAQSGTTQTAHRTDAMGLEIPVVVHASRNSAAPRGIAKPLAPVHEETRTVIVFPQGAVVRLTATVAMGELVVLTNQRSGADVLCRVTSVKAQAGIQNYVGLDFTQRAPAFWGDCFPAERPAASATGGLSPQPSAVVSSLFTPPASSTPAPVQAPPAQAPQATNFARTPAEPAGSSWLAAVQSQPPTQPLNSGGNGSSAANAGFGIPNTDFSPLQGAQDWAQRATPQLRTSESPAGSKKILIFAIAAVVLLAAVGGGVLMLREQSANPRPQAAQSVPASQPAIAPTNAPALPQAESVAASATQPPAQPQPAAPAASVESPPTARPAESVVARSVSQPAESAPAPKQIAPRKTVAVGKLAAPVAKGSTTSASLNEAPPLMPASASAAALGNGLLLGAGSNSGPAAPSIAAPRAVSQLQQAKATFSPAPAYPSQARSQRIQGDVLVDALVDANGRVSLMKVISGPAALQAAATAALAGWRYQPARLDGQPVASHVQVRITFHLQ